MEKSSQTATPKVQAAGGQRFPPQLQEVLSTMAGPTEV